VLRALRRAIGRHDPELFRVSDTEVIGELIKANQTKGHMMKGSCQKCGGLLVLERVLDYYGPLAGMKCVNCGWSRRDPLPLFGSPGGSTRQAASK
jgi:hypothetical protein